MQNQDGLITISFNLNADTYAYNGYNVTAHYYAIPVGIHNLEDNNIENFACFPNPSSGITKLKFTLEICTNVEIGVYDITGKEINAVFKGSLYGGPHEFAIETNKLPAGTYLVGLVTESDVITTKVMITK